MHTSRFALPQLIAALVLILGCGDGSAGGTDGQSGKGGAVSGGSPGVGGGGAGGTKGSAGGSLAAGGAVIGSGGIGAGGSGHGSGGAAGTGGSGGSQGTVDGGGGKQDGGGLDVAADRPQDFPQDLPLDTAPVFDGKVADVPVDAVSPETPSGIDTRPAATLDSCFAGLPAAVGTQMVATKSSSDGRVRLRIALDTEDSFGTSGTYAWHLIRLAVEVNGVVTCISDRARLTYTTSHHNCGDKAQAVSGTTTYALTAPDRSSTGMTIGDGGAAYLLTDTACSMAGSSGPIPGACRSGGPC